MLIGSMCAGDVRCYAAMVKAGEVVIDATERHLPLRHSHHRYVIDAPNGPVKLTVPLVGSTNAMPVMMRDVLVSEHGNWRHLHWGALFSSYGKSPFFDFIADDLHHIIIEGTQQRLLDFNMELHQLIVDFMDLPITTHVVSDEDEIADLAARDALDLRGKIGGKRADTLPIEDVPYYQMWANRRDTFHPRLSILDLLMNEGREGIFTLLKMMK
ncbi:MAG: WbqC family protein [Muribaculaceae bacterium]|nr:WbqC family protein [Muribaculaceae bacterium]